MRLLDRIPHQPWIPVLCGVLVVLPTLGAGLIMDDVLARVKLLGIDTPFSPAPWWDLYTFARADLNPALLEAGMHPWWADPTVKMTFFRPLSAATHVLDYWLWPDAIAVHHLHSVLWYGLAVFLGVRLVRRLHPDRARLAAIAGLVFAVAMPHAMLVGWLSGRNTIISFVVGVLLIEAHLRWRRGGRAGDLMAGLTLLAIGLLTGEAALGALGYIAAWQLCLDRGPGRARLLALAPYGVVVIGWWALYTAAGFGSSGSGIYFDPGDEPIHAAAAVGRHLPVLLLTRWFPVPVEFWAMAPPPWHTPFAVFSAIICMGVFAVLWPLLRQSPAARFWGVGMTLSLLPFTLTMPMDRLVFFAGPGAAALLAMLALDGSAGRIRRRAITALLVINLPLAAASGLIRAATIAPGYALQTNGFEEDPRDAAVPGQTFVFIANTFHRVHYATLMRRAAGDPAVPRRVLTLTSFVSGSTVTRVDADTLEVEPDGGYLAVDVDRIHRRVDRPLEVGETVELPDVTAEILALASDGRPARVAFHFKVPLSDPSLRWLTVAPDPSRPLRARTEAFEVPAIGETARVEGLF